MAGQRLALEPWHPSFIPSSDALKLVKIWVRLLDLPLELWDSENIKKIVAYTRVLLILDNWTSTSAYMGYARACLLVDLTKPFYPRVRIKVQDSCN